MVVWHDHTLCLKEEVSGNTEQRVVEMEFNYFEKGI